MPTISYVREEQGHRVITPRPPLGGISSRRGLRGLGASNTFSGCDHAIDASGNLVDCNDPSAAVWFDANMNAISPQTGSAAGAGGAPTGSLLLYQGVFQTTPTLNVNTILSRVQQAVKGLGLQVTNQQTDGGAFTLGNFNVSLVLQVTGPGFAQPADAGSIVDHAYYSVVGRMPVQSAAVLQSGPGRLPPSNVPGGASSGAPGSVTLWLEQNALWIGLGIVAVTVLPGVVKKL